MENNSITEDNIIRLMRSSDYKDRMKGEILELRYRTDRLYKMVVKYESDRLEFTCTHHYLYLKNS